MGASRGLVCRATWRRRPPRPTRLAPPRRSTRRLTAPTSRAASRSRSAAPPRTRRESPAAARSERRGLDDGGHLAPGAGTRQLDLLLDPGRHRQRHDQDARRRRQRQPRDPRRGRDRQRHPRTCPCSIWDDSFTAPEETTQRRSRSASSSAPTRTASSPACASTRPPATPAPTSATCGRRTGPSWPRRPSAGDRLRLAGGQPRQPGGDRREHDLRRLLSRPDGQLRLHQQLLRHRRLRQRAAARARRRGRRANGVYKYGPSGGFPDRHLPVEQLLGRRRLRNTVGPDTTPPTISARSPANGASGVATGADVTATFSEPMDPSTINGTNVELRDPSNALVPATVTYNAAQRRATLDPNGALQSSTTYTATVKGGPGGVKDASPATRSPPTRPGPSPRRRRRRHRPTRGRAARSW